MMCGLLSRCLNSTIIQKPNNLIFPGAFTLVFLLVCSINSADGPADGDPQFREGFSPRLEAGTLELLTDPSIRQDDALPSYPILDFPPARSVDKAERKWTILFYDDADFDNAYDPLNDFASEAYSSDSLDVLVLQDTNSGPAYMWHLPGQGGYDLIASLGEVDMGDAATLRDFVQYGKDNYPAERYLLCLYDHGGGYSGACIDQTCNPLTILSMNDFQIALEDAGGVDIIAFTAPCTMGAIESVYELRDLVDVYVGSEDLSGFALWWGSFTEICSQLENSTGVTTEEIGAYIVQVLSENDMYPLDTWTMSAIAPGRMSPLVQAIDELAVYLGVDIAAHEAALNTARAGAWVIAADYDPDFSLIDLVSLMEQIALAINDPIVQDKTAQVIALHDAAIIDEWHGPAMDGAHGLSIYFPRLESRYSTQYENVALDFTDNHHWDELLHAYYSGLPLPVTRSTFGGVKGLFR